MHGGDLRGFAKQFGVKEEEILDFSSNINPLGIPPKVSELYPKLLPEISIYPNSESIELRDFIASRLHLSPDSILVGNGSMSLIGLAIRALRPRRALLIEPCFNEYRRLLELEKAEIVSFALSPENQFQFSFANLDNLLTGVDLVILGHPNNPTGTCLSREDMKNFLDQTQAKNISVLLDEAFVDWRPENSMIQEVKKYSHVLAIRSLTKFYALAGLRVGYAVGPKSWIDPMKALQDTWSCNRLAQKLALAALEDKEFETKTLAWFKEESHYFYDALSKMQGVTVFPSCANFFLVQIPKKSEINLYEHLGKRGVYIRQAQDFSGLDSSYFRFALRNRADNLVLLTDLKQWFKHA